MAKEKAKELEEFQESASATGDEPEAKRRRSDKQVGEDLVRDFLEEAKSLPADAMTEEEVRAALSRMKEALLAKNNSYVAELLARSLPVTS